MQYTIITLFTIIVILFLPGVIKFITSLAGLVRIWFAKQEANALHGITNKQFYVLKWRGKIKVKSAMELRNMKKRRQLNKSFNWLKLQDIAIYKTK